MRKNYLFNWVIVMIAFLGLSLQELSAQNYVYVGTATTATTTFQTMPTPFGTYYEDGRTSYLILASELQALGAAGSILSLAFDVSQVDPATMNGFNLKIGHTTATSLSAFVPGLTNVYSGTHVATSGWNNFTFSAPFAWDGVSNVVVEVCFDNGAYTDNSFVRYSATTFNSVYGRYADGNSGCSMTNGNTSTGAQQTYRPNMRIEFTPPLANDAATGGLINPSFPTCAMDSNVKVELINYGTSNLTSATMNWSVNGNIQPANAWTGNLASFEKDTVTLGVVTGGLNDGDNIVVWSSMPNGVLDSNNINDTLAVMVHTSLSGTYTIDASGAGDYVSFAAAVSDMVDFGICAATVFEVANGTYVEQVNLTTYDGMSMANNVTFRSQSGDASLVTLSYSATGSGDNYVVNFNNASYFNIENITMQNLGAGYSRVVTASSSSSTDIMIDGCVWKGVPSTSSWDDEQAVSYINGAGKDNWTITNNTIIDGNYGLYLYGDFNTYCKNNVVNNNTFIDQYYTSSYIYYQEDGEFIGNEATSNSTLGFSYGFYFVENTRFEVSNNHVKGNSTWPDQGMYFSGMTGDLNTFLPITNNRVVMKKSNADYGIRSYNSLFVELAHNSVYMNSSSGFDAALEFDDGSFNKVKNNIFINDGTGSVVYIAGSGVYEMDYNNLSAPNGGDLGYTSGTGYTTIADWTAASGFDSNSVSVNNVISDTSTFKVCNDSLYGAGTYLAVYMVDYEGDMRQDPPCIGADEFMPISQFGFSNSPVLCDGDTLTLTQDYFDTVVWNTTDTSNTYDITAPGSQQVAVYDLCGSDTSVFTVMPQQVAVVGDTNLCEGTTATLNSGISGGTYMWSNDLNANTSTDSVVTVDTAMTVYVEVIDMHGCTSMDTAVVTQSMDVVLADSATFCEGANVVLDANMQGTYLWSDGSTNQTLSVTSPGSYSVTVTDQNCVSSATSYVTEILDAVASFNSSSSYLAVQFTNTSQNGTSYLWDFGDGTTSTEANPTHIYPWTNQDSVCKVVTLTVTNSCGSNTYTNDCVRIGVMVSVSEVELASLISVYPNPNAGVFTVNVKADEAKDMSVEVLDVRGAQVFVQSYGKVNGEVNRTVNLEGAAQGIYFVKVTLDGETAVYRISVN